MARHVLEIAPAGPDAKALELRRRWAEHPDYRAILEIWGYGPDE